MSGGEASAGAAVGVAVAQFAPTAEEGANLAAIDELTARAVARGAEVVLFPEYASYFVDPFDDTLRAHAQDVDGDFTRGLREIASRYGAVVVAGLVERGAGDRVRNAVVAVGADGVRAVYRKLHLYDAFGQRESDWVEAGTPSVPETFEVGGLRFALMTCYDLRFPEVARVLAVAGADVLLIPAAWFKGDHKIDHWQTLLKARAVENTVWVVAAGTRSDNTVGHSAIVDPLAIPVAHLGEEAEAIATAEVTRERIDEVRSFLPVLQNRRTDVLEVTVAEGQLTR